MGSLASEGNNVHKLFIEMSIYNNFNEEVEADVLWKKIGVMFENKNVVNRVSVLRKIVSLWYQDGSSWRSI